MFVFGRSRPCGLSGDWLEFAADLSFRVHPLDTRDATAKLISDSLDMHSSTRPY